MRKKVGILKRMLCLLLIFLLSINSFAAIVSDNDGSAFITKAEFDALKSSFQAQIDTYNQSIDSKIDGAIASYLAGIKLSTTEERAIPVAGLINAGKLAGKTFDSSYSRISDRNRTVGLWTMIGGNNSCASTISGNTVTVPNSVRIGSDFQNYWHAWSFPQKYAANGGISRFTIGDNGQIECYGPNDLTVVTNGTIHKSWTSNEKWFVQKILTNPVPLNVEKDITNTTSGVGYSAHEVAYERFKNTYDSTSRKWISNSNTSTTWTVAESSVKLINGTVMYLKGTKPEITTYNFFWKLNNNNIVRDTRAFDYVADDNPSKIDDEKYMNYGWYSNNASSLDAWLSMEGYVPSYLKTHLATSFNYVDLYCASDDLRKLANLSYKTINSLWTTRYNHIDEPLVIFENVQNKVCEVKWNMAATFNTSYGYIYVFARNESGNWTPIKIDGYDTYINRKKVNKDTNVEIKCNVESSDKAIGVALTNSDGTVDLTLKSIDSTCLLTYTD